MFFSQPTTGKEVIRAPKSESSRAVRFQDDVVNVKELDFQDLQKFQNDDSMKEKEVKQFGTNDTNSSDASIYTYLKKMGFSLSDLSTQFKVIA